MVQMMMIFKKMGKMLTQFLFFCILVFLVSYFLKRTWILIVGIIIVAIMIIVINISTMKEKDYFDRGEMKMARKKDVDLIDDMVDNLTPEETIRLEESIEKKKRNFQSSSAMVPSEIIEPENLGIGTPAVPAWRKRAQEETIKLEIDTGLLKSKFESFLQKCKIEGIITASQLTDLQEYKTYWVDNYASK